MVAVDVAFDNGVAGLVLDVQFASDVVERCVANKVEVLVASLQAICVDRANVDTRRETLFFTTATILSMIPRLS